jgi:glyoxylase I family protein
MSVMEKTEHKAAVVPTASRLHHHAYPVADQEATRHFYEDIVGLPLVQFWIEDEEVIGERHVYSHAFYGLKDGGCMAFFNFSDPDQAARYKADIKNLFVHISLNVDKTERDGIRLRLKNAGYDIMEYDHGYTYSIYVNDPDGLLLEFSVDPENSEAINENQRRTAHQSLKYWQSGGREPNNDVRHIGG